MAVQAAPRIPAPPRPGLRSRRGLVYGAVAVAVIALHVLAWRETEFSLGALADGWRGMVNFLGEAVPPDLRWGEVLSPSLDAALITLYIALLGTTLSVPAALGLAILAARTTTPSTGV